MSAATPNPPLAGPPSFDRRLHTAVLASYTRESFTSLLALDMQVTLANVTQVADFDTVATEFIAWARRENRLGEFLDRATKDKPKRSDIAALRDEYLAASAPPEGLTAATVEAAIGRFAGRFRNRSPLFGYLNAYKHLHEVLHGLCDYLGQLAAEAEARRVSGAPVSEATAAALRRWASDAARWWRRTELPDPPRLWVAQLAQEAENFLGPDTAKHPRALARLESLPPTYLLELNGDITQCAGRLRSDELLPDVDTTRRLIELAGGSRAGEERAGELLADVADAAEDIRDPLGHLPRAIRHDTLCQEIDTQFRQVRGLRPQSPDDILGWDVVLANLETLKNERTGDTRTAAVIAAARTFAAAQNAAAFDRLQQAFDVLFMAMDEELLSVTTDLLTAANRLTASLGGRG